MKFTHVMQMELLKLKRSYVWLLMIIAPLIMVIFGASNFVRYKQVFLQGDAVPWDKLLGQVVVFYAMLLLPLSIAVMAVWLARIEHSENNWKHLFVLPIKYVHIYVAKTIVHILLVGISMLFFFAGMIVAGKIVDIGTIPYHSLAISVLLCWITCLPILAVQMLLSIRFHSLGVPVGVGLAASIAGIVISNSSYGKYYLWSLPSLTLNPGTGGNELPGYSYFLSISLISFLIIFVIGFAMFRRRDVQ